MNDAQAIAPIDALLPQTQCGRCGYERCRPYAEAISAGQADINRCPPGGEATINALASLLGLEAKPLDSECGGFVPRRIATVEEQWCLGCTRCLAACPVDAILGASGQMHTVIAEECTGCERCIVPCPVDCIQMIAWDLPARCADSGAVAAVASRVQRIEAWPGGWTHGQADRARTRYQTRQLRLAIRQRKRATDHARKKNKLARRGQQGGSRRDGIEAMLARVRARRRS